MKKINYIIAIVVLIAIIVGVSLITTNKKQEEIPELDESEIYEEEDYVFEEENYEITETNQPLDEEYKACTLEYMPLCGIDGVTYANACMAEGHDIAYSGECKYEDDIRVIACESNEGQIDIRETDNYEYYVCVFEDNSECEAWLFSQEECNKGEYVFDSETRPCTREYNPVCGINGVTYSNPCVAGNIPIVKEGSC